MALHYETEGFSFEIVRDKAGRFSLAVRVKLPTPSAQLPQQPQEPQNP